MYAASVILRDTFGLVGQVLDGQFRVDAPVGDGGFSTVYRGSHLGLNEPIAIKCLKLPPAIDTSLVESFVRRFRDESRIHYKLSQGNLHIARTLASGTTMAPATGALVPYMVLEWLDGISVAADFDKRRKAGMRGRTIEETIALLDSAADALAFAHAQGVVHRDLNPGNLFLAQVRGQTRTKVLDFGVAKVVSDHAMEFGPRIQTQANIRIFSPSYGAPEQFDQTLGMIGSWTDVYSLAQIATEMLRDKPSLEADHLGEFASLALDAQKRPTPRTLGIAIGNEVEAVFAKALQVAPTKRWQDAGEFWGALKNAHRVSREHATLAAAQATPSLQMGQHDDALGGALGTAGPFGAGASVPAPRPLYEMADIVTALTPSDAIANLVAQAKQQALQSGLLGQQRSEGSGQAKGGLPLALQQTVMSAAPTKGNEEATLFAVDGIDEPEDETRALMPNPLEELPVPKRLRPLNQTLALLDAQAPLIPTERGALNRTLALPGGFNLHDLPPATNPLPLQYDGRPQAPPQQFAPVVPMTAVEPAGLAGQAGQSAAPMHGAPVSVLGAEAAPPPSVKSSKALVVVAIVALLLALATAIALVIVLKRRAVANDPFATSTISSASETARPAQPPQVELAPPPLPVAIVPTAQPEVPATSEPSAPQPTLPSAVTVPTALPVPPPVQIASSTPTYPQAVPSVAKTAQPTTTTLGTPSTATPVQVVAFNESAAKLALNSVASFAICKDAGGLSGPGAAMVVFTPQGSVSGVTLYPPWDGSSTQGACVARQLSRAKVSAFEPPNGRIRYSFNVPK
jgi:serine/threonine protein kinase/type II secretory pathway pseudopilin PulG